MLANRISMATGLVMSLMVVVVLGASAATCISAHAQELQMKRSCRSRAAAYSRTKCTLRPTTASAQAWCTILLAMLAMCWMPAGS